MNVNFLDKHIIKQLGKVNKEDLRRILSATKEIRPACLGQRTNQISLALI